MRKIFIIITLLSCVGCNSNNDIDLELPTGIIYKTHQILNEAGYVLENNIYTKINENDSYQFDLSGENFLFKVIDEEENYYSYDWNNGYVISNYCYYFINLEDIIISKEEAYSDHCLDMKYEGLGIENVYLNELEEIGLDITYLPRKINEG